MSWNSNWPDGTQSVKNNRPTGQTNTNYIQTELNKDHFWNIGVDEDGHHKWAQMVATNDANKSLETNATLATGMDLVYFNRFKTTGVGNETVAPPDAEPFYVSNTNSGVGAPIPSILQLLGIRAMAVWNNVPGLVTQNIIYKFNVNNVTRQTLNGRFGIQYQVPFPNGCSNYLVLGGGISSISLTETFVLFGVGTTAGLGEKTNASCVFNMFSGQFTGPGGGVAVPPGTNILQGWIICFGG